MTTLANHRFAAFITTLMLLITSQAYAETATRTSAFEYDPVSGLITKEIIEPGSPDLCLVTEYTYDAFGNKLDATTRNCNGEAGSAPGINDEAAAPAPGSVAIIASRTVSTTYDAQGRFPVTNTNALGQSETKVIDERFGVVTSLTGPNGLTTTWTYDSFGRKLTESRADGTSSQMVYALCDVSCPTNAQYTVTSTQAGAPYSKNYYDMHSRVIQTETQDKDGAVIYSQTEYDKLGRTNRTSRPAKVGSALAWTSISYDVLGRPISTTAPDNTTSTVDYSGYTTVATNALSQARTEVRNSQGQLVSVTDTQSQALSYEYDAFGNLTKTTDALGNQTAITYDARGRKVAMNDPDQGGWSYAYDALGQLKSQTDAKAQTVTFAYDTLGRMTSRTEPDLISTWEYDTCDATLNPAGKCIGKPVRESSDNGYIRTYLYDSYGRHIAELDNVDQGYGVAKTYDEFGRVGTLVYPTGFSIRNVYSATGHLSEVRNASTDAIYWQAGVTDNEGRVVEQTYGNGVVTNTTFNANTGLVSQIMAGSNGSITNQSFVYDSIGNLTQRYNAVTGLNESFGYDSLNRLTATTAQSGATTTSVTMTYDAIGNITSKSDVGTYTYGAKPHAVTSITMNDGVTNYGTYTYDANGNMLSGKGRTISWTSWNMPTSIVKDSNTYGFIYNSAHERVVQTMPTQTIYNISPRLDTGIHVEKRVKTSDGSIEYVHSLYAGKMPFGNVTTTSTSAIVKTRYFHTDHLGSIVAITDELGAVVERRSYDAWGKRRNLDGTPSNSIMQNIEDRHGFTGHEELEELGIIHMNGRMYDPSIGRFMSADPTIQYADDMQNYNRYSYINNNPLSAIDYSGFGFLSKVWKGIKKAIKKIGREIERGVKKALSNPVIRTAVAVAAAWYIGVGPGGFGIFGSGGALTSVVPQALWSSAGILNGIAGGFAAGFIASGGDLKAGFAGAISGGLFSFAGDIGLQYGSAASLGGHAAAGCASAVLSSGSCGQGAASAIFGKMATLASSGNAIASIVAGGTASVIGGGKFINGAATAGFGYLFNCTAHKCKASDYVAGQDGYHEYLLRTDLNCNANQAACMLAAQTQISCGSAPGSAQCVPVGIEVNVTASGGNNITQFSPTSNMIVNGTSEGHLFDDGYVVRWIGRDTLGNVSIWTYGRGVNIPQYGLSANAVANINEFVGKGIFSSIGIKNKMNTQFKLLGW